MPIPCFMSSCSIALDTDDLTGQLVAEARLASTGSILCDDEVGPGGGLYVQVSGIAENANSGIGDALVTTQPSLGGFCGQSLKRTMTGNLFAAPEGSHAINASDAPLWVVSTQSTGIIPGSIMPIVGSNTPGDSGDLGAAGIRVRDDQFTNPFSCEAWCLFTMPECKIIGRRVGNADEKYAVIGYSQIISITGDILGGDKFEGPSGMNHRFDVFATWIELDNDFHELQNSSDIHALFRIEENGTVTVRTRMVVTRTRNFNMETGGGGVALIHPAAQFWRVDTHRQS